MKKYYIECFNVNDVDEPYCLQSKWFDTKEEAISFYKQISYTSLTISLMSSVWDNENDIYTDIEFEGNLN